MIWLNIAEDNYQNYVFIEDGEKYILVDWNLDNDEIDDVKNQFNEGTLDIYANGCVWADLNKLPKSMINIRTLAYKQYVCLRDASQCSSQIERCNYIPKYNQCPICKENISVYETKCYKCAYDFKAESEDKECHEKKQ